MFEKEFNMKKIIAIVALILSSVSTQAYVLEAKPLADLESLIQSSTFKYKETGMVFGFSTIKSCLYVANDIAILKNYCVPKKEYPAAGYTIISPKFGIIDLYQEDLETVIKHDIQITTFPDILKGFIKTPVHTQNIAGLNKILEGVYKLYGPACWSTNATFENQVPEVQCYASQEVIGFDTWSVETQKKTNDMKAWKALMEAVEATITRHQQED